LKYRVPGGTTNHCSYYSSLIHPIIHSSARTSLADVEDSGFSNVDTRLFFAA